MANHLLTFIFSGDSYSINANFCVGNRIQNNAIEILKFAPSV